MHCDAFAGGCDGISAVGSVGENCTVGDDVGTEIAC